MVSVELQREQNRPSVRSALLHEPIADDFFEGENLAEVEKGDAATRPRSPATGHSLPSTTYDHCFGCIADANFRPQAC